MTDTLHRLLPRHGDHDDTGLADPYDASGKYALGTVGFLAGFIGLFALARALSHLRHRSSTKVFARPIALWRYFSVRQLTLPWLGWHLPVLGTSVMILSFYLFMFIWTWAVRPYYRELWSIGSPPLAIRSGMMALGCFPFIFAFASKVNAVTFVTGVSHEKLQVYHQYLSHIFLFLSWVHTIPFLIQGLSEYRPNFSPPTLQLNYSMLVVVKVYYWTGVILLFLLGVLCWASFSGIRRRNYELFKWVHIFSAILFIPFFFLHCNRLLGSWEYLYATVILYGLAVVARFVYLFLLNGAGIPRAECEVIPGGMVKLHIKTNPMDKWKPGQHYFINFLTCEPFQSHPFTLANNPTQVMHDGHMHQQEMILFIREAAGLTQKLRAKLEKSAQNSIPVLLDGPYGGLEFDLSAYEHVLLIAGGVGITFILPILQDVVHKMEHGGKCKTVQLIWSVRTADAINWIQDELEAIRAFVPKSALDISIHVTREDPEKKAEDSFIVPFTTSHGRADLPQAIAHAANAAESMGTAACGPIDMVLDIRNAVANVQSQIIKGGHVKAKDVFLHTEEYSW